MLNLLSGIQLWLTKSTFNTCGNPKLPWKLTLRCPLVARRNFTKKIGFWQPLTLQLLLYDLQLKTVKPLLQTDYLNKHKWNTRYHTFVITKASECANLPSIHIHMHIIPVSPPKEAASQLQCSKATLQCSLSRSIFNNTFIKDLFVIAAETTEFLLED